MPKHNPPVVADPLTSKRWSKCFSNVEQADLLLLQPGWVNLMLDLQAKVEELSSQVVHEIPATIEHAAQQNYWRGKIAGFEDLLEFAKDLADWKADHR